jgi:hypothetical protein
MHFHAKICTLILNSEAKRRDDNSSSSDGNRSDEMMSFGVWVSTLFFLFLGLTFATLNLVFTLVNVAHSPVRYEGAAT